MIQPNMDTAEQEAEVRRKYDVLKATRSVKTFVTFENMSDSEDEVSDKVFLRLDGEQAASHEKPSELTCSEGHKLHHYA